MRQKNLLSLAMLCLTACGWAQGAVEAGKTYSIALADNPQKSLFVNNSVTDNLAAIVLWTETNVPSQQWTAEVDDQGRVAFKNVYTGKYLNYSSGRTIQHTSRSWWTVEEADGGNYYLRKTATNCLHVNDTKDGTSPTMGADQAWTLREVEPLPELSDAIRERMANGYFQQYMKDQGVGYLTFCNGGWGESETLETILDLYEATGDRRYLSIYESCYSYFRYHVGPTWTGGTVVGGYDWFGYDFNDDVMWHIIGAARAYLLSGNTLYLNDAKRNFDLIYERSHLGYIDMLRWAENSGDRNGTNSCINGPAEVAACYIALGTGDESYFDKARALYANQRQYLANMSTGQVYDSMVFDPATMEVVSRNNWASTYNQGTMLGAAVLLYQHYGETQYRSDADKIISYSRTNLCDNTGIIKVCQDVSGDFQGFKGILMRYVGLYLRQFKSSVYEKWLTANAMRAFCNMNSKSFGHSAWLTKAAEDLTYGSGDNQKSYNDKPFGGSTPLAAAFAVPSTTVTATVEQVNATTFNIQAPQSGRYRLNVFYKAASGASVSLAVNDADAITRDYTATTEDYVGLRPYFTALREGDNTVTLASDGSGTLPSIERIEVSYLSAIASSLEAEQAEGHGTTTITNDADASYGRYMGRIGSGANNYITFYYDAEEGGEYDLDIVYFAAIQRQMYVRVNNGSKAMQAFPSTGSAKASSAQTKTVRVTLKSGTNTISMGNDNAWAPNVDRIELRRVSDGAGISDTRAAKDSDAEAIYDLKGYRLRNMPQKGIVIVGGKKVVKQ